MKKYILCSLLLLLNGWSGCAFAQSVIDSLYVEYEASKSRGALAWLEQAELLSRVVDAETHRYPEKALLLIDTLASHYFWLGDLRQHYHVDLQRRGVAYARLRKTAQALKYYEEYARAVNLHDVGDGYFLIEAGNLCYSLYLLTIAKRYYEQAELIFAKNEHYAGLSTVYGNYSLVALEEGKKDTALRHAQKALDYQLNYAKDSFQTAHAYQVVGRIYAENFKDHERAVAYYDSALAILYSPALRQHLRYNQYAHLLPQTLNFVSISQYYVGDLEGWRSNHAKAMAIARRDEIPFSSQSILLLDYSVTLLAAKEYETVLCYTAQVDSFLTASKVQHSRATAYRRRAAAFEGVGKLDSAIHDYKKVDSLMGIFSMRSTQTAALHEQVLQNERNNTIREQQKSLQTEMAFNRRVLLFSIALGVAFAIALGLLWLLRKKNQLISQNAQKLAQADEAKALLLSVIGHDLRSPFNSIFENLQLAALLNPENKAIAKSQQAAKGAFVLLDGLMQWVSLQRDLPLEHSPERVDIDQLLADILLSLQNIAAFQQCDFQAKLPLKSLYTDSNALQIILRNLLLNALSYSLPDTAIELQADTLSDGRLRLYVRNHAAFIPDDIAERIQARNQQLHRIALKGSGLGLHLVADFAQKLHVQFQIVKETSQILRCELIFPADTRFEMDNSTAQNINTPAEQSHSLPEDVHQLQQALRACSIFESSRIQRLLNTLPANASRQAQVWREQILQAMLHIDEPRWQSLLNEK